MSAFSHRDRRMHRTVARGFAAVCVAVTTLTLFVLAVRGALWETLGVVALAASGGVYLLWSQRVLSDYSGDLRTVGEGSDEGGFLRAETAGHVGLSRSVGRPSERSPHVRRRPRGGRPGAPRADQPLL